MTFRIPTSEEIMPYRSWIVEWLLFRALPVHSIGVDRPGWDITNTFTGGAGDGYFERRNACELRGTSGAGQTVIAVAAHSPPML